MSIDFSGLSAKVQAGPVLISVSESSSLMQLANLIDWQALCDLVLADLKKTPSGKWWLGRKMTLRIHLGAYILQSMFNETDRGVEERLNGDAVWQLFCGRQCVDNWHVPDHTRIEDFRSRLSPQTHHELGLRIVAFAKDAGFAKAEWLDIDSTVQEANISYPSDVSLMLKLTRKANKLVEKGWKEFNGVSVEVSKVAALAKEYFFAGKNQLKEYKQELFRTIHQTTVEQVIPVIEASLAVSDEKLSLLGVHAKNLFEQVTCVGTQLLAGISSFIKTGVLDRSKPLSLHAQAVACIKKGKLGRPYEFGRVFQLGRIKGNFLIIARAKDLRESDKSSAGKVAHLHRRIFGGGTLENVGADRGYHSKKNVIALKRLGAKKVAVQKPAKFAPICDELSTEEQVLLANRRAGIEPLIGHAKHGGLRRSRMKKDVTTEASAYRSVMGFNLRQLSNALSERKAG